MADALSKLLHKSMLMVQELELIEQFRDLSLVGEHTPNSVKLGTLKMTSCISKRLENVKRSNWDWLAGWC